MIPLGGIILWSGAIIDIPENWQLCDGTNGTPDLQNRFVVGAGTTYAVDETGGELEHIHATGLFAHTHEPGAVQDCAGSGPASAWDSAFPSASASPSATVEPASSLPEFTSLAFIQLMS